MTGDEENNNTFLLRSQNNGFLHALKCYVLPEDRAVSPHQVVAIKNMHSIKDIVHIFS